MKPEDRGHAAWLRDMEGAAGKIVADITHLDFDTFTADERTRDFVMWQLMVIGEAAGFLARLHPAFAASTGLPLGPMRMFRNRLVHAYFNVDANIVWSAVRVEIPAVLARVRQLLTEEDA